MIVVVDYGVGNLFSVVNTLKLISSDVVVSSEKEVIEKADKIILPGVGAFRDAVNKLKEKDLFNLIKEKAKQGTYILGICLGMQLLFEKSFEFGEYEGLGLLKGEIRPIDSQNGALKIPHMGWNKLKIVKEGGILSEIKDGDYVYFVHSYCAKNCPSISSFAEYGEQITATVWDKNVFGCQFHPEKSGEVGLKILKAFCELE